MRHTILRRHPVVLLVLLALIFWQLHTVEAKDKNLDKLLSGDYAASITGSCALDPAGFDAGSDYVRLSNGFTFSAHLAGVLHYNGDGTGTFTVERLRVIHGTQNTVGQKPVFRTTGTCGVTYTVNPDGSITQTINNCISSPLEGNLIPNTDTFKDGFQLDGQMGGGGNILVFRDTALTEETVIFSDSTAVNPDQVRKRICGRSGTAIRK